MREAKEPSLYRFSTGNTALDLIRHSRSAPVLRALSHRV
jgi:hypothetical protein